MRVAITGIAGFLGSHLARRLTEEGHTVCGVDLVHPSSATRLAGLGVEYHWGNAGDMVPRIRPVDVVVHCASVTNIGYAWANPRASAAAMIDPTIAIMDAMTAGWAKQIIVISTHSVYGKATGTPFSEADEPRPMNLYGALKLAQESIALSYARTYDLNAAVLRMALMYGEQERDDATTRRFLEMALRGQTIRLEGGGKQTRDFNYVGNAVDAIIAAMSLPKQVKGQVYNISSGEDISIRQLAEEAIGFAERGEIIDVPERAGEEGNIRLNYHRAHIILGYAPKVRFEDGFRRAAEWVAEKEGQK